MRHNGDKYLLVPMIALGITAAIVQALDKSRDYANNHSGVSFARKDEIAEWILK